MKRGVQTVCPLFTNNSKKCEIKFHRLAHDVQDDFCTSDNYQTCPLYRIIEEKRPYCEHIEECSYRFHRIDGMLRHNTDLYKKIMHLVFEYCLTEKKEACVRYQRIIEGKRVPKDLLQNKERISIRDLLSTEIIKLKQ